MTHLTNFYPPHISLHVHISNKNSVLSEAESFQINIFSMPIMTLWKRNLGTLNSKMLHKLCFAIRDKKKNPLEVKKWRSNMAKRINESTWMVLWSWKKDTRKVTSETSRQSKKALLVGRVLLRTDMNESANPTVKREHQETVMILWTNYICTNEFLNRLWNTTN